MLAKKLISLLLLCCVLQFARAANDSSEPKTLSFGVVPQQAASKLARLWNPILRDISAETGYRILFKTAPDIPEFERRLFRGEYDLAYMNPYHYTVFQRTSGYRAFAKQQGKKIRGILVVLKGSNINELSQLGGQTLAFPAPAAFAASILPRCYLASKGIEITPRYVSSHDSVYRGVAKGLFAAGGGIERTFNNVDPAVREQLRILWTTASYTPHAFAAHPRISEQALQAVATAFISLAQSQRGRELLTGINFKGIEAASDSDWDDVRALQLDLLDDLTSVVQ